eukprot:m51a1_g8207 hypothetical protein (217) ;mRNA; r:54014-56331
MGARPSHLEAQAAQRLQHARRKTPSQHTERVRTGTDTRLPMMYMDDALKATADILEAPREQLRQCVYSQCPNWTCSYVPDFRQGIAESWPQFMDDRNAREQWGWSPRFATPDAHKHLVVQVAGHARLHLIDSAVPRDARDYFSALRAINVPMDRPNGYELVFPGGRRGELRDGSIVMDDEPTAALPTLHLANSNEWRCRLKGHVSITALGSSLNPP